MSIANESRVGPSDIAPNEQAGFERLLEGNVRPVLITESGDVIDLPRALNDLLLSVVNAMKHKQAVFLMHEDEAFTTQAAANFLGVPRSFLVSLLEGDKLPFHHVGTHRRVFFKDLVAYQHARSRDRRMTLDAMTLEVCNAGFDEPAPDVPESETD